MKPDELDKQIKFRAQAKYKASTSEKKKGPSNSHLQKKNMDPRDLGLLAGTFVTEDGGEVSQIEIDSVAAERSGIAFGTLEDVGPYLKEDRSISTDALAILTTIPVPPANQGLMPVCNLRYPAVYLPTKEVVLIEGSMVQLGDSSVVRKQEDRVATTKSMETKTYKYVVWKD